MGICEMLIQEEEAGYYSTNIFPMDWRGHFHPDRPTAANHFPTMLNCSQDSAILNQCVHYVFQHKGFLCSLQQNCPLLVLLINGTKISLSWNPAKNQHRVFGGVNDTFPTGGQGWRIHQQVQAASPQSHFHWGQSCWVRSDLWVCYTEIWQNYIQMLWGSWIQRP